MTSFKCFTYGHFFKLCIKIYLFFNLYVHQYTY